MSKILDGKKLSEKIFSDLKVKLTELKFKPVLSIIICGNNPASILYASIKEKKGLEIGISVNIYNFPENVVEKIIIKKIKELNHTSNGIIIQLPLPSNLNAKKIINVIYPYKDVDGLTALNLGNTLIGDEKLVPATPKGIIKLIEKYNIHIKGKYVVIVNHSNVIGKPLAAMMLKRNATVTVCHDFTKNLAEYTKKADILITAVGKKNLITSDMVKEGAVVIDAGITIKGKKIFGDVDFDEVKKKASFITPVPGGIGPMTVVMLMENVVISCTKQK